MIEILLIVTAGVLTGVLTGLMPGIHPNTVIFTSVPFYFSLNLSFGVYAAFISGVSVSHTFHDFIPSIFLGVPDPASALSTLPGQEMAMRGRGLEAFDQTVYGGLYAMLTAVIAAPLLYFVLEDIYAAVEPYMAYLLLFILLVIVFKSDNERNSMIVAVLSGTLGLLSFSTPVNQQYVLTPIFGGLFAAPSLINALKSGGRIPEQIAPEIEDKKYRRAGFLGFLAAVPMTIFPGLSSSVSTTFLYPLIESRDRFLAAIGGVNTADIFLSFLTLLAMERARSGASVAVQMLGEPDASVFVIGVSVLAMSLSIPIAFLTARYFVDSGLLKIQKQVSIVIFVVLLGGTFHLTGALGLLIFFTASAIGCFASLNSDRHACMAVLLVPSITFFATPGMFM